MRKWCHRITTITDTSINIRIIVFQKYLTKENTLSKKGASQSSGRKPREKEVMRNFLLFLINDFFKDVSKELKI